MPSVLVVVALLAAIVLSAWWTLGRSRGILEAWAHEQHLTLLSVERRYLRRGPFFWRSGKGHEVFHVRARDASGRTRQGFVRVGGWWAGLLSDKVVVEWDD